MQKSNNQYHPSDLLVKVVTPVKTGVQKAYDYRKRMDSGLHRNDRKSSFQTFCEPIIFLSFPFDI